MLAAGRDTAFRFYLKHFFSTDFSREKSLRHQHKIFDRTIRKLSGTQLGKDLHLQSAHSYNEFARHIPVTQYDFYEGYVDRIKSGEQNVMSADRVRWLAKTAGTTSGKSKLIPITRQIIRRNHVRSVFFGLSMIHKLNPDFQLLAHKTLIIPGGIYETLSGSGIIIADISAIMAINVPVIYRSFYTPDLETQIHPEWDKKIKQTAAQAINEDVGTLSGVPTWHLASLMKIKEQKSFEKLTDVWENLRLFIHGGVSFEPYRKQFEELTGRKDFIFYEVYNATEGFFGIQRNKKGGDLLLVTDSNIFFEFIAFDEFGSGNHRVIPLSEVKTGIPYVMLITASNGLVRYVIGDVITFTDLNPFSFRITGRTQEYINAFGEDLLLSNVERALMKTLETFPGSIREYTVAPFYINIESKGRMQMLIEFSETPADIQLFEKELDVQLQRENSNYAQKRNNDLALGPLELIVAPQGTFHQWLASKGKLGGQNKVPRLVNGRTVMEDLLRMLP